ncbi:MAG: ATP-NAD kinase family protein [Firmicutes bacterium]|nr:ATP-NAD kinase family protein [Bacillota bacterium]
MERIKTVGLIINPVAGIGGPAGLKGSDGEQIQKIALQRGAVRQSGKRAETALNQIKGCAENIRILCAPGEMGEEILRNSGFSYRVAGTTGEITVPEDTERIAAQMKDSVDILLFAGGDGTARNIYNAVGDSVPVIGIPAGVKIHSGVFAINPSAAGKVLEAFITASKISCRMAEVIDLDEEQYRNGRIGDTLYGYMPVPSIGAGMQNPKAASHNGENDLEGICAEIRDMMAQQPGDTVYIMGAGSTVQAVESFLGIDGTLLGLDVLKDGKLIAKDVTAEELVKITASEKCRLVLTAIGGQGHIFGRGNQQLKPDVIRNIGIDNIWIVAAASKIYSLPQQTLLVDTGDASLDEQLAGYHQVIVGWQERLVCRVM